MAPMWFALTRELNVVQFAWVAMLALVITTTATTDVPTAVVGATVVIVLLLAVTGQHSLSQLHSLTPLSAGPPREEQRLRGSFRRQSAPDTPGRPRLPRAPGQVHAAA